MIDRAAAVGLLQSLVRIPSVNPRGEDSPAERDVATFVADWLNRRGVPAETREVLPGRPNVTAILEGMDTSRSLLLEAHLDTVEVAGMVGDPFDGRVEGNRLYGRGSCDTKGSLAAFMLAVADLAARESKPPISITLVCAVDEEHLFKGILSFLEEKRPFVAAIVGEPTGLDLVVAHKGMVRFRVVTAGKAAHSSMPWDGDNAIERMVDVVGHIRGTLMPEVARMSHPLVGPATMAITLIQGGTAINVVPDRCSIDVDRRTLPGEDPEAIWRRYKQDLEALPQGHVEVVEPLLLDHAMETDPESPVVRALAAEVRRSGREPRIAGVNYGTDGSKIALGGTPTVVFGPGSIQQAHQAVEFINLEELVAASTIVAGLLERFDGTEVVG